MGRMRAISCLILSIIGWVLIGYVCLLFCTAHDTWDMMGVGYYLFLCGIGACIAHLISFVLGLIHLFRKTSKWKGLCLLGFIPSTVYLVIFVMFFLPTFFDSDDEIFSREEITLEGDYTAISGGWSHTLALKSDGSFAAWGDNRWGMADPPEGEDFVAIAAGTYFSLALKSDGSIVGWGRNTFGQTDTPKGNDFIAIAARSNHALALKSDGSIVGWGNRGVPRGWDHGEARPPEEEDFVAIAAGYYHNLALKADGTIIGWGSNSSGQSNPPSGNNYIAISAGADHSLALKSDGSIVGWGSNTFGELDIPEGNDFTAISAGCDYSLALKSDGSIVGWGHNSYGQAQSPKAEDFVAIAAGNDYSLALKSDGSIVGWGQEYLLDELIPSNKEEQKKKDHATEEAEEKDKEQVKQEVTEAVELDNISSLQSFESPPKRIRITAHDKLSIDLVYIKPGSFIMGRDIGRGEKLLSRIAPFEASYPNEGPPRKVKITKGFYIGKYKVTCAQFCEFLNSIDNPQDHVELNNFSRIEIKDGIYVPRKDCENGAINVVHWKGAVAFCQWLSKQTGFTVRLPTEAEWEFVACGPEGRAYPWGEDENVKYYADPAYEYKKHPHPWSCDPVDAYEGTATPEGVVGMICMLGEWCSDYYVSSYMKDDLIDPRGPTEEDLKDESVNPLGYKYRVYRGRLTSSKGRAFGDTVHGSGIYGFRILVELPQNLRCSKTLN